MADKSSRTEKAIWQQSKRETDWFTEICENMVRMRAYEQCAGCYLREESSPRKGYKFTVQSSKGDSVAWLEESCFLAETERLGLYDPITKKSRETDLDLDYIFAEPTAEDAEPTAENAELTTENAEPTMENAEPTAENAEPTAENAEPTAENPSPLAHSFSFYSLASPSAASSSTLVNTSASSISDGPSSASSRTHSM